MFAEKHVKKKLSRGAAAVLQCFIDSRCSAAVTDQQMQCSSSGGRSGAAQQHSSSGSRSNGKSERVRRSDSVPVREVP